MKLTEIANYRNVFYEEFLKYKQNVGDVHENLKTLIEDYLSFPLLKGFNVLLKTSCTQKLFYPSYYEFYEKFFIKYRHTFKTRYNKLLDIEVNLSKFFDQTLQVLNQIDNVCQAAIVEIKPGATFVPHIHEPQTVALLELTNNTDKWLKIKVNDKVFNLNGDNPLLIFDGSQSHEAIECGSSNRVYILICCK